MDPVTDRCPKKTFTSNLPRPDPWTRPDGICMNAYLQERHPRHDEASQTTTHRPEGGAPKLITVPKKAVHFEPHRAGSTVARVTRTGQPHRFALLP